MIQRVPISRPIPEHKDDVYWAGIHQHRNRRLAYQQRHPHHNEDDRINTNRITSHTTKTSSSSSRSRPKSYYAKIPIANCQDILYTGTIYMGTPHQSFNVKIDTSTSVTWIPSELHCDQTCRNSPYRKYNSSASTTYNATIDTFAQHQLSTTTLQFREIYPYQQSAVLAGTFVSDTLHIGNEVSVTNYVFAELTTYDYIPTCLGEGGGRLGLGLSPNMATSLWNSRMTLQHPVFSIYMNSDNNYLNKEAFPDATYLYESEIVFGGINIQHYQDCLQWHTPAIANTWNVGLHQISVGTTTNDDNNSGSMTTIDMNGYALFDTGKTGLLGNPEIIGQISSAMGLTCYHIGADGDGLFRTECNNLNGFDIASLDCGRRIPPLNFILENGMTYTLTHDALVKTVDVEMLGPMCMVSISSDPEAALNSFIFGDVFFHQYYVVFNVNTKAIGLAPSMTHKELAFNETTYQRCEVDYPMDIDYYVNKLHLLPGHDIIDDTSATMQDYEIPSSSSSNIVTISVGSFVTMLLLIMFVMLLYRRIYLHRYYKRANQSEHSNKEVVIPSSPKMIAVDEQHVMELPGMI